MKYKNTKTGAIIDSPCIISGGDWIEEEIKNEVEEAPDEAKAKAEADAKAKADAEIKAKAEAEAKAEVEAEVDPDGDFNGITIAQIKQELDAFGIAYNPKAKKQELYDLMMQGR